MLVHETIAYVSWAYRKLSSALGSPPNSQSEVNLPQSDTYSVSHLSSKGE